MGQSSTTVCQAVHTGAGLGLASQVLFSSALTDSSSGEQCHTEIIKGNAGVSIVYHKNLKFFIILTKSTLIFLWDSLSIYNTAGFMLSRKGKVFVSCMPPVSTARNLYTL